MKAAALIGTLSVSLYTILLLAYTLTPAQTHHVVFEEIGEMAGALSYIHVVVPINISGLLQSVNNFRAKVAGLKANYVDHKSLPIVSTTSEAGALQTIPSTLWFIFDNNFPGSWT